MAHIVAGLTWNSRGWRGVTEGDKSAYGNVARGWRPNESWNFDRNSNTVDGYKYAAFERGGGGLRRILRFANREDIVFFRSSSPSDGDLLVGLYARPILLDEYRSVVGPDGLPCDFSVMVPLHEEHLICPFEHHLLADPERHYRGLDSAGILRAKRPGQSGFFYINNFSAANIVNNALELDPGNEHLRWVRREYGF